MYFDQFSCKEITKSMNTTITNFDDSQDNDLELRNLDSLFEQVDRVYQTKFVDTLIKDTARYF